MSTAHPIDVDGIRRRLTEIRDRYFRSVIKYPDGAVVHHGDCEIFAERVWGEYHPCTCGLMHDLDRVDCGLAKKVYPAFLADGRRQCGIKDEPLSEETKQQWAILREVFGEPNQPSQEEQAELDAVDWLLIAEVFGQPYADLCRSMVQSDAPA